MRPYTHRIRHLSRAPHAICALWRAALPNCVVTPHLAGGTRDALADEIDLAAC